MTTTEARPLTEQLLEFFTMLDRDATGAHRVAVKSLTGFYQKWLRIQGRGLLALPDGVLAELEQPDVELRLAIATGDHAPEELPALFVLWKFTMEFSKATAYRHRAKVVDVEAATSALVAFTIAPTFVIDALHERVAVWLLDRPLHLRRDLPRAQALHDALAARLQAPACALTITVPLAGVVRNASKLHVERIRFVELDVTRRYRVEDLERALAPADDTTPTRSRRPTTKGDRS
jgi:hypothetical protein